MKKITNLLQSEVALLDIRHNRLAFLFGCIALSPLIGFIPPITPVYYMMLIFVAINMIINIKRVELVALLFIIACALSIILASPPSFFKSWGRLGLFALVYIAVSPMFQSRKARKFREAILQLVIFVSVIVGLVSFVFYFFGINYMVYLDTSEYIGIVGRFGGLTRHSMVLGPISAIAAIYCSYRALNTKNKIYWLLVVPCVACVLFSASRGAFISAILGFTVIFYINSDSNKVFLKKLLPLVLVLLVTFPLWKGALSGLQEKQQKNVEMMGGTSGSRDEKWSNRLEEFNQSPIWGMGFSACDPQNDEDYMRSTGIIEPGSSWLAVLSMTGLIGFIPFVIIACKAGCKVWKYRKVNQRAPLYIGLIAFLFTHMLVEGYILAGGAVFCFVSWLIIASCYDLCD